MKRHLFGWRFLFLDMRTFLEETIQDLKIKHGDLSRLTLILPSKRAGGFLKNYLKKDALITSFAPKIISIESFIEILSDLTIIDTTELLFKSYEAYQATTNLKEKEDFESYASWATTLLNDFNEVDRYLADPKAFFGYLGSIKTLEKWNSVHEQTDLVKKYLAFWNQLYSFYEELKERLLKEGVGYQGLVYRRASEEIEHYIANHGHKTHIFIGFNALNTAEQHIIQELLETGNSDAYWDVDAHFYNDSKHSASLFLRKYFKEWKYFSKNTPKQIANNYQAPKEIEIVSVQKNMGQAKYVGNLLANYSQEQLSQTALVLADESLLTPILHSLPPNVTQVNITMGVPLKTLPTTVFFELLLLLHQQTNKTFYYKDVISILNHPLGISLIANSTQVVYAITSNNLTHLTLQKLLEYSPVENHKILSTLFGNWEDKSAFALKQILDVTNTLQKTFSEDKISRVALFHLHEIFTEILGLHEKFPHLKTIKSVHNLFKERIATAALDFGGDAYNGLQIMGVLETRVLDFKNIIMTSVNEGVLPTGKSNASFITYDLKKEFGLPMYTEKDAIYTYHFYRLLHRAQHITLLYNDHSEGINTGEKSRFLLQLEIEKQPEHQLKHTVVSATIPTLTVKPKHIHKTEAVLDRLKEIAAKGFSPSALTSYIRNPIDFYYQKILRIQEFETVEEIVAANTLGTIVHDTLEAFYKPLEGSLLTSEVLLQLKKQTASEVKNQFEKTFKGGTFDQGKNLIIFEVAKRYVSNFIDSELTEIKAGNSIKILQIESDLKLDIDIPNISFPVKIGGKVDRVDEYNGKLRIIDYKTGKVNQGDLEIVEWDVLIEDYAYSKAFQVLAYASMIDKQMPITHAEAGVISFKNLQNGFLNFATKPSPFSRNKDFGVTPEILDAFKEQLIKLIVEICNPEVAFEEKEIESYNY